MIYKHGEKTDNPSATPVYKHHIFLMLERDLNYIVGFVQHINDKQHVVVMYYNI